MNSQNSRAYSLLHVKDVNEDTREMLGIASTVNPDRYMDVVEPKGAEYSLPLPLLWQHDSWSPVGQVTKAKANKDGIEVVMKLAKVDEPGTLRDRLEEAWQSVKTGLVRGLSIGFNSKEYSYIPDTGGVHFQKWEWLELSLVTIPANAEASITGFKSMNEANRIALIRALSLKQRTASGPVDRGPVTLIQRRVGRSEKGAVLLDSTSRK